jgi:hypothetical protein
MILGFPSFPMQEIIAGGTGAMSAPPFHFILAILIRFLSFERAILAKSAQTAMKISFR